MAGTPSPRVCCDHLADAKKSFPHLSGKKNTGRFYNKVSKTLPLAKYLDHTLLKADAGAAGITKLCNEAKQHGFYSVCVNSGRVVEAVEQLKGTEVKVCAVAGFPLGAMDTKSKVREAVEAVRNGATEIDMVLNIGKLKEKNYTVVGEEIASLVASVKKENPSALVKVILETCLLTTEQIIDGCILCVFAEADFVKTSTGFSTSGATPAALDVMKATVGNQCMIKAAGGVKDTQTAKIFVKAGIHRIGTSSGVALVAGAKPAGGY